MKALYASERSQILNLDITFLFSIMDDSISKTITGGRSGIFSVIDLEMNSLFFEVSNEIISYIKQVTSE